MTTRSFLWDNSPGCTRKRRYAVTNPRRAHTNIWTYLVRRPCFPVGPSISTLPRESRCPPDPSVRRRLLAEQRKEGRSPLRSPPSSSPPSPGAPPRPPPACSAAALDTAAPTGRPPPPTRPVHLSLSRPDPTGRQSLPVAPSPG